MICAPWDTEMFHCLADGRDHTPCCAAKQVAVCYDHQHGTDDEDQDDDEHDDADDDLRTLGHQDVSLLC